MKNQHIITVLENCLRVLDTIPDEAFDLASWQHSCRTTACLIGHCCHDSWFNEQGLRFKGNVPTFTPLGCNGWEAVLALLQMPPFFGRGRFVNFLFSDDTYVKTKRVNVRVRLKRVIALLQAEKPITRSDLGKNLKLCSDPIAVHYFNTHFVKGN